MPQKKGASPSLSQSLAEENQPKTSKSFTMSFWVSTGFTGSTIAPLAEKRKAWYWLSKMLRRGALPFCSRDFYWTLAILCRIKEWSSSSRFSSQYQVTCFKTSINEIVAWSTLRSSSLGRALEIFTCLPILGVPSQRRRSDQLHTNYSLKFNNTMKQASNCINWLPRQC